jgi:hypothetical protein
MSKDKGNRKAQSPNTITTKEAIKERVTAAPFRPFSVRLTGGRSYPVPGPDYASVSPNGRLLTVYTDGGNGVKILHVALITEIEVTEA